MAKSTVAKILFLLILLQALSATANDKKDNDKKDKDGTPRFVSRVSLVLIPTVVTDHAGNHVTGLKKDDFAVLEDGQPQKIALFEEVQTRPGLTRPASKGANGFSNVIPPEARSQRLTIIVMDTLDMRLRDQDEARRDLLKFVSESLPAGEPVALMSIGYRGLQLVRDFTTDPKLLAAAVRDGAKALTTTPQQRQQLQYQVMGLPMENFDPQQRYSLETTMEALREIAGAFAGVPGRKSLIWATGGLPFLFDDPARMRFPAPELIAQYQATWNALSEAQIVVYPLDVGGLADPAYVSPSMKLTAPRHLGAPPVSEANMEPMTDTVNLERFGKMTGGMLCVSRFTMTDCFRQAERDATQYYLLGYYVNQAKGHSGWRKLAVKVDRDKVQVRSRSAYYVASSPSDPAKTAQDDLKMAVFAPADFTAVPVTVHWTNREPAGAKTRIGFHYEVPGNGVTVDSEDENHLSLDFAAFAKTAQGDVASQFLKEVSGKLSPEAAQTINREGVSFDGELEVAAGDYTVRFVVRDNLSGRIGTVSVPLQVAAVSAAK